MENSRLVYDSMLKGLLQTPSLTRIQEVDELLDTVW